MRHLMIKAAWFIPTHIKNLYLRLHLISGELLPVKLKEHTEMFVKWDSNKFEKD